jgi:hypothetical protein
MIIYFSGDGGRANPERTICCEANVMLTFYDNQTGPTSRMRRLHKNRVTGRTVKVKLKPYVKVQRRKPNHGRS